MIYIVLCSSDNVLSVKGGGNAWTILKLLEKFYKEKNSQQNAIGIFADTIIFDENSWKYVDSDMDKKTKAFLEKGELPFKKSSLFNTVRNVATFWNFIYKKIAPIYYLWLSIKRNVRARNNLIKYVKNINIGPTDTVILDCHDPFSACFISKIKFPCQRLLVAHSHEIGSQAMNILRIRNGKNFFVRKIALFIEKTGYKKAEYVSFSSRGSLDTLIADRKDLKELLDNKEVKILYTGIKTPFKKSVESRNFTTSSNLPIKLLFVGRLVEDKGFDLVLEAAKILNNQGYNFEVSIVGYGDIGQIKEFLNKNNLNSRVFLLGVLPHDKVLESMMGHDVLVAPHRRSVFDLVMLEAMHVGLPIISTAVGGNVELITSKNQGILVEPNNVNELVDGLKLIIDDQSLRLSLAVNAQKYAEDFFSEEAMFERYKNFFKDIIKK